MRIPYHTSRSDVMKRFSSSCSMGLLVAVLVTVAVVYAGCSVTAEDINTWKGTQRGPEKLEAAVGRSSVSDELRTAAALALVDIREAPRVGAALAALPREQAGRIAAAVAKALATRLEQATGGTPPAALRAKDALFLVRPYIPQTQQEAIDRRLVAWLLVDWGARTAGEHSAPQIIEAAGAIAGPLIAETLASAPDAMVVMAEALRKVGSPADRQRGAQALVAVSKRTRSRAERARLFEAVGKLDAVAGRRYLLSVATEKGGEQAARVEALQALALGPGVDDVPALEKLAADPRELPAVREAAFAVLERLDRPETAAALANIVSADPNETVRYRAAEAIIACCKVVGAAKLLNALSPDYTYKSEDVVDFLERDVKALGGAVLPVLRQGLESGSWIARLVSIRVLGDLGQREDIKRLGRLVGDTTRLPGWKPPAVLGAEAALAMKRIEKRGM